MNRQIKTILSISCLLIAAGVLYTGGFRKKTLVVDHLSAKQMASVVQKQKNENSNQVLSHSSNSLSEQRSTASVQAKEKEAVVPAKDLGGRPQSLVIEFTQLKKKVFKTDSEQKNYKNLLRDRDLLIGVGKKLTDIQYIQSVEFAQQQNAMVDLLVEALTSGDRVTSQAVVTSLVQDASVENEKLPMNVRQNLAGLKAELLYQVTALFPEEFKNVADLLPGPVSQKIWANVQASQQRNIEESQAVQQRM